MNKIYFLIAFQFLFSEIFAQDTSIFVNDNGIMNQLHRDNIGRIAFMDAVIPLEQCKQSDFLTEFEISDTCDLNIRVFLRHSLTNELHALAPELSADELTLKGNYNITFYSDEKFIYTENLNPGAGSKESKNLMTVIRVPLLSSSNEDSWGRFLWQRFWYNGGEDALSDGTHRLKIEIRPYVIKDSIIKGNIIAQGEIDVKLKKPVVTEPQIQVQAVEPGSGFEISKAVYDKELIKKMNLKIAQNSFKNITGVIVVKKGELLAEEYFNGTARDSLHDTRSVGKSFASAILGIAIEDGFLQNEDIQLSSFYDLKKYKNYSRAKDNITLKNLLTMSSGFLGSDSDPNSPGNEENMYPTNNWVKFVLDLPMDSSKAAGKNWDYFTGGVVLLGDILNNSVPGGLEKYADKKLFAPLGIKKYQWEYTPQGVPNTAGGLRLRAIDYARFGQLYSNGGIWNGRQVIPKKWTEKSLAKNIQIPGSESDYYGYLFWNTTFNVNGKKYEVSYSSGNGGNKIFIFKDIELVVVVTSTAYGMPYAHRQVNKLMEEYILPAVIN
jgi:CubicO group peptidase (beta-lactamase class C family)